MKPWVIALATLAVLGALGTAMLMVWRGYRSLHSMLMQAGPTSDLLLNPDRAGVAGLANVRFTTPTGLELAGWYVPPVSGAAIVLAHGTWSNRSALLAELQVLHRAGYGVLAFDWPGLGQSPGTIRWNEQARGALGAAVDWLVAQPGVDPQRIGGLGFSMGGFLLTQVAARDLRLRAVVLESAAPDFNDYVRLHGGRWGALGQWGGRLALRDSGLLDPPVQALALIQQLAPRPVLLIGGSKDQNVTAAMVQQMYAAAREPKDIWIVDGAAHGDYVEVAGGEYTRRVVGFFDASLR